MRSYSGYLAAAAAQTHGRRARRVATGLFAGAPRGYARGMEYVIPVILVLIIVAAGVTAFVLNSKRKTASDRDGVAADSAHGGGPGTGADATPLGDTAEHAGPQSRGGETVGAPDAAVHGGTGHPVTHYGASVPPEKDAEYQASGLSTEQGVRPASAEDDGIAPKGEGRRHEAGDPPDSERLADRRA